MLREKGAVGHFVLDFISFQGQAHSDGVALRMSGNDECFAMVFPTGEIGADVGGISISGGIIGDEDAGGIPWTPLVVAPDADGFYDFYDDDERLLLPLDEPGSLTITASGGSIPGFGPLTMTSPDEPLSSTEMEILSPDFSGGIVHVLRSDEPIVVTWDPPAVASAPALILFVRHLTGLNGDPKKQAHITCRFSLEAGTGIVPAELLGAVREELEGRAEWGDIFIELGDRVVVTGPTVAGIEVHLKGAMSTTFGGYYVHLD